MIKKKAIILCVFVFACFALFFIGINSVIPANAEYEEQSTIVDDDVQFSESVNIQMNSDKGKNGGALLVFGKNERSQFDNVSIDSLSNVKLIKNANYFIINPKHAENSTKDNPKGTCTTVAMQLLTGYHNYYSDRRILPVDSTEYQFVSNDYGDLSKSPIFKRELVSNGCSSLGTEEGVFRGIFNNISGGGDGDYGQAIPRVVDATKSFIKKYAKEDVKNSISLDWGLFSSENAKKEIDNDRPVVLGMLLLLPEKSFHVVPAYGYATVNGKNGFLVHYGWGGTGTMVWVPASNFGFCVTMSVNHQHNLIDTGKRVEKSKNDINGDTQKENYTILKCVECKYTTPRLFV